VLRSEWTKLRSVRSTTWSLLATIAATVGIGVVAAATEANRWTHLSRTDRLIFDPTNLSLTGLLFGQLAIGVLGVLVMSGEYGTGTIRATLAAIPNRPLVLAAKAAVFGAVALVVSEVASFAAFFIGQAILGSGPAPHASLSDPAVLRAVMSGGLYLALLGLLALGLATIIRHTAGAITTFVGVLLVVPLVLQAFPSSIRNAVAKYLPANLGQAMTSVHPTTIGGSTSFSPWVSFSILCGYAIAALAVGGWLLARRDA
jgi:ABC-type transport system involved in multi-copper enzyme maturation permease subunit